MAIPRAIIDPFGTRQEQGGLRWLGWEPHLSGAWRLWRTGDRPLEFEGLCLTPRFAEYDEVPPFDRFDEICQAFNRDCPDHCSFYIHWPDYRVAREEMVLTCDGQNVDVLVVRADSGQLVLGWTEEAFGTANPPAEEVREPYDASQDDGHTSPFRFLCHYLPPTGGIRFRVEVFNTAEELRTWVESAGKGRLAATSTRLVRWAVDLASEFEPALDVTATAERLPSLSGRPTEASQKAAAAPPSRNKREAELDAEARKGLRDFACSTCGEVRNLLDFYDEIHEVWFTKGEAVGLHIDHGEASALMPTVDVAVSRQAEVLTRYLAQRSSTSQWWSVFDIEAEEACCEAFDSWTLAKHVVDHRPKSLIELAGSNDHWSLSPWVATSGHDDLAVVHERLQQELRTRGFAVASNGLDWEGQQYDDPMSCANDLLTLLEGAGIARPLIVQREKPQMGDVLVAIVPE